jgi:hypothetical protein
MLIVDDLGGAVADVPVRLRDRIASRLHADELDRELARGASPDRRIDLALRARTLTSTRSRQGLGGALHRILAEVDQPTVSSIACLPLNRLTVTSVQVELKELRGRLLADGPVNVRGVAQIKALVTQGRGPLAAPADADQLGVAVRRVIAALDFEPFAAAV